MFYSDYKGICTCWQQQPNPSQIKPIDRIFFHYFSARWTLFLYQQHNASKQDRSNERPSVGEWSFFILIGCNWYWLYEERTERRSERTCSVQIIQQLQLVPRAYLTKERDVSYVKQEISWSLLTRLFLKKGSKIKRYLADKSRQEYNSARYGTGS